MAGFGREFADVARLGLGPVGRSSLRRGVGQGVVTPLRAAGML
jgi:hypothetical protein